MSGRGAALLLASVLALMPILGSAQGQTQGGGKPGGVFITPNATSYSQCVGSCDVFAASTASGASYTGPGNVKASASVWYSCSRGYSASYATGSNNGCNLRRASDNSTQNIVVLSNGNFDSATANTFAGTDATASCTIATTTATCTGASSTPHVGSTITGTGLTQPCVVAAVGTFTGGAGTMTVELAGTTTSCGTISVAETLTMQYGLFVTKAYDESGHSFDISQATSAAQPQWLPNCGNVLPCIQFYASSLSGLTTSSYSAATTNYTMSAVSIRVANFTTAQDIFISPTGPYNQMFYQNSSNTVGMYGGSTFTATASDNALHAFQAVFNGVSSVLNVDNTQTSGSIGGTAGLNAELDVGFYSGFGTGNPTYTTQRMGEFGIWLSVFNSTDQTNMCHNQYGFYTTAVSC